MTDRVSSHSRQCVEFRDISLGMGMGIVSRWNGFGAVTAIRRGIFEMVSDWSSWTWVGLRRRKPCSTRSQARHYLNFECICHSEVQVCWCQIYCWAIRNELITVVVTGTGTDWFRVSFDTQHVLCLVSSIIW